MSEEKPDKSYGLDPVDETKPVEAETPPEQTDEPDDEPDPEPPAESSHIKGLDVCPNCASPLGGVDAVVCLRCGFDMKTLKVIKVETGETVLAGRYPVLRRYRDHRRCRQHLPAHLLGRALDPLHPVHHPAYP